MATKLVRSYTLTRGKNIRGMGQAIEKFFGGYKGTKVTLKQERDGSYVITCTTDSVLSAPDVKQKFNSAVRKVSGNIVEITVTLIPKGNQAEVHYRQDICETLQAAKAVFKSFALVGISELYGIRARREIPIELNAAICRYLNE